MKAIFSKLKDFLSTLLSLRFNINYTTNQNQQEKSLPRWLASLLVFFGTVTVTKLIYKFFTAYLSWPSSRKRLMIRGRWTRQEIIDNGKKWVVVYGACNQVGSQMAHLLARQGYSIVLVDVKRDRLENLQGQLLRVFPAIDQLG